MRGRALILTILLLTNILTNAHINSNHEEASEILGVAPASSTQKTTSDSVSLEEALGPLVINEDGSAARIGNWGEMSEIEKRNVVRIVGARNRKRTRRILERGDKVEL